MLHFNVANGGTCFSAVDFSLPGFIPFDFERNYKSGLNSFGVLGWNWTTPLDVALFSTPSGFCFRDQWGHVHSLNQQDRVPPEEHLFKLSSSPHELIVTSPEDLHWRFSEFGEVHVVHRIEDASGNAVSFEYDSNGLVQVITDSFGRRVAVRHEGRKIIEFQFLPRSSNLQATTLARYAYDNLDNLITVWDANGNACHFDCRAHLIVHYQNRIGGSQYASYDAQGRCLNLWCGGGEQTKSIQYDDHRRTAAVTDSRGATTLYRWNDAGFVTEEVNAFGATTSSIFDDGNKLIATLDERGDPKLTTVYDEKTRTLAVTDASGATTTFEHDSRGRVQVEVDACGSKRQWHYDKHGRVERVLWPSGAETQFTYDANGFLNTRTDRRGNTLTQSRNADGTSLTLTDSLGLVVEYRYDELGRYTGWTDAAGERCFLKRDSGGRILECMWPDNSRVQYAYDAEDNLIAVIDELGNSAAFSFDSFSRCLQYNSPLGDPIYFEHDAEGELVSIKNEDGQLYRFEYDLLGRVVRQSFPDGRYESYFYDDRGDLVRVSQGDGTFIDVAYSQVGRITAKSYSDGTVDHFSYDPLRRLIFADNESSTIRLKWDQDGNLIQEQQGDYTLDHEYDLGGNRIQSQDSAGRIIRYSYDPRGHLILIADSIMGSHKFEYDSASLLRHHTLPNGASLDMDYDARDRVVGQRLDASGKMLTATYQFDSANRLIAQTTLDGAHEKFSYDACDRLCELSRPDAGADRYRYDSAGNVTQTSTLGTLSYALGSRLRQVGDRSFVYDARGALTDVATSTLGTHFVYDIAGRLTKILRDGSDVAAYAYDPLGRRIKKSVNGVTTAFRWNGFVLLGEDTSIGTTDFLFDESRFLPLSRSANGTVDHFVADRRGCVVVTLDESAGVKGTFQFDAFGALRDSQSNGSAHPFRLRGQYFDAESELHYNFQRYYDPSVGRFLTCDPFGIAAGLNPYKYGPNTLTWEDPFGLENECQGDVFYRAMSTQEKQKVLADCQLHAKKSKCPEGPYVTQTKKYCESALREKPDDYKHLAEICTEPGTVSALQSSPYTGMNGSQASHWPPGTPAVASGQVNRIELKWERLGRPDEALNYGLSKGKGLETFNGKVKSMKFTPTGETCTK